MIHKVLFFYTFFLLQMLQFWKKLYQKILITD